MVRPNHQLTLKIVLHEDGHRHYFLVDVTASIRFVGLRAVVKARCDRWLPDKFRLLWLTPGGDVVEIEGQSVFQLFAATMWCAQPWVVHVVDERTSTVEAVTLTETARSLFDRYDVNYVPSPTARTHVHAFMHPCIHASMHTCIHAYVHRCIRAYIREGRIERRELHRITYLRTRTYSPTN